MQETQVWPLGWEDPLQKGMETYSSIFAWRITWTEESGGLVHGIAKSRTQRSDEHVHIDLMLHTWLQCYPHKRTTEMAICTVIISAKRKEKMLLIWPEDYVKNWIL